MALDVVVIVTSADMARDVINVAVDIPPEVPFNVVVVAAPGVTCDIVIDIEPGVALDVVVHGAPADVANDVLGV